MRKHVIILRGLPGSGKTFFSNLIKPAFVVSMDHFWTKDGQPYHFDYSKLKEAIAWTHTTFQEALADESLPIIIVDNVNYAKQHFDFFVDAAVEAGAVIHFIHVERPLEELDSSHDVAKEHVYRMAAKWEHIL